MDDVVVNKLSTIQRCLKRILEVHQQAGDGFSTDYTRQDSVMLNLQRACEATIDVANYLVKKNALGIPQSARDSFQLLFVSGILSEQVSVNMKKIIGLRNIAVHDYQELSLAIVEAVIIKHLTDFEGFIEEIKRFINP